MKYNIFYTIIIVIALISCHEQRDNGIDCADIYKAENMLYQHPDSALAILEEIPINKISNKADKATWALLVTQAKYKLYINQTDSLINIAYNYFMNKGNAKRKAQVLYCKASLYSEKKETNNAQRFFLQAAEEIKSINDYKLAHLIYSGLGHIYSHKALKKYALNAYHKAYDFAILSNECNYIISSLTYLGRIYGEINNIEKSIKYYQVAIKTANENRLYTKEAAIMTELASIYIKDSKYQTALTYTEKCINFYNNIYQKPNPQLYLITGDIYNSINKEDSAAYFYSKALKSENLSTQRAANINLFYLNSRKKEYKTASRHLEKAWILHDSIYRIESNRSLIEMQEKYNQQVTINENNQLKLEDKQKNIIFLLILVITIILISLIIFLSQKRIIHQKNIINKVNEDIRIKSEQIQNNEIIIKRNQIRISELEVEMNNNYHVQIQIEAIIKQVNSLQEQNNELITNNNKLQIEIKNNYQLIKDKTKQINQLNNLFYENQRLNEREQFLSKLLIQNIQVFKDLKESPKYIEDYQWKDIEKNMDYYFDNFTDKLKQKIPAITDSDIQICYLIKLHINNSAIATMLAISPTSVTKRKQRLKERILQEIGKFEEGQTLEMWLYEL